MQNNNAFLKHLISPNLQIALPSLPTFDKKDQIDGYQEKIN